jgi:lipopolysaccharide export LptBFGC system permease protein LptF
MNHYLHRDTAIRSIRVLPFILVALIASFAAFASDNRIYTYAFQGMLQELEAVREGDAESLQLDVSTVVEKYIPRGRPMEELFSALHNNGFRVHHIDNKKDYKLQDDQEGYVAILHRSKGAFWSLGLMSDELIIRIITKEKQVIDTTASIKLLHP